MGGIFVLGTGAFVGTRTDVREMGKGRETVRIWTSVGVSWGGRKVNEKEKNELGEAGKLRERGIPVLEGDGL